MDVIHRYLDCGDLHFGFARVKCEDCGHEYLLAYSCKRRHFCPSCHQKRVAESGEWLCEEVLKYVPHRQWVFSIPKRLRIYFMMVPYYGFYSNQLRGLRKKVGTDDQIKALIESEISSKEYRKNWTR